MIPRAKVGVSCTRKRKSPRSISARVVSTEATAFRLRGRFDQGPLAEHLVRAQRGHHGGALAEFRGTGDDCNMWVPSSPSA